MGAYIVRRLIGAVFLLIALSMLTFLLFNALPADPARLTCGKSCTPQVIEANRHRLGYDKPLVTQYTDWVKGVFVGRTYGSGTATFDCHVPCLGYSFRRGEQVTDLMVERFPVTMQFALGGFVLWMVTGVGIGIVAALKRGRWPDRLIMGAALVGYSFPSFFIALLLIYFVQIRWGLIGFYQPGSVFHDPVTWVKAFTLPWIALALLDAAFYSRLTRNQMLETMGEDFVRTARAKGLPERTVIGKHALRAGISPIVTAAGLDLAGLLGGAIILEQVFGLNGIGKLAVQSVIDSDLPLINATTLVGATFIILANLVVDVLYAVIDPRVTLTN